MAQPTARHEGDQGGEEQTAVSQTPCQAAASTQPRSMPVHLAHRAHPLLAKELSGFKKSGPDTPSSSSSSTHLEAVAAECPQADSKVHVSLPQLENLKPLRLILWAAKSSAVLLCCGRDVQLQAGTLVQLLVDLDALITTHKFLLGMGRRPTLTIKERVRCVGRIAPEFFCLLQLALVIQHTPQQAKGQQQQQKGSTTPEAHVPAGDF
ncbi:hypothetical protein INR49_014918 [Caranx melampygus]|nr:hypothetical protein INR49_014918 [Caranx melampygus]